MAYIKLDEKKFKDWRRSARMFQDDIVCAVGTDFMHNIAEAENRMIFDILSGLESEATADVVEVVRCKDCKHWKCKRKGVLNEYIGDCHNNDFPFRTEYRPIMRDIDFCSYGERTQRKEGNKDVYS